SGKAQTEKYIKTYETAKGETGFCTARRRQSDANCHFETMRKHCKAEKCPIANAWLPETFLFMTNTAVKGKSNTYSNLDADFSHSEEANTYDATEKAVSSQAPSGEQRFIAHP
ncbi:MAG: hypothetical protein Q4P30_06250, partial [Eubacteriales bacterium]|nr:hypothetical protein [Eubacteriales bacterium]